LDDEDESVRRWAANALGHIGPEAQAAIRTLERALADEELDVRVSAGLALTRIGLDGQVNRALLVTVLGDALIEQTEGCWVKTDAAEGLREIGPAAWAAVPSLAQALTNADRHVRYCAAEALECIGPGARAARAALRRALLDEDEFVRRRAESALSRICTQLDNGAPEEENDNLSDEPESAPALSDAVHIHSLPPFVCPACNAVLQMWTNEMDRQSCRVCGATVSRR
jgi:HEAT repeats